MNLENQLKDVKVQMLENIQCYFTRRSQLKQQLESIRDNVKEEATDLEGDEVIVKQKKDLVKKKVWYFRLHWISHVSSLKTPKDMFDALKNLYEDDLENSTQVCEDINVRKSSMLLHKEISTQEAIRSH